MATKLQFFDALALAAVVAELNALGEVRIDKVGQPSAQALYLNLRAGGRNLRLYLGVAEQWARIHLTTRNLTNIPVPTSFTMQLRKHLEGARLLRVEQPGLERVARLVVAGRDELGDPFERVLVVELIGKFANMFLVDGKDETVMGCLRPITDAMCQVRQVLPGLPYDPPPPLGKLDLYAATDAELEGVLSHGGKLVDCLVSRIGGLPKVGAAQLMGSIGLAPGLLMDELENPQAVIGVLRAARASLQAGAFYPRLDPTPTWDYQMWWLGPGAPPANPGPSALLDAYYFGREDLHLLEERRGRVKGELATVIKRQRERLAGYEETLAKSESADRHRELGDLLTAHMYDLALGQTEATVTDFYHPEQPELVIPLDPRLTPSENVQRHFKRYQKARNARQVVDGLLTEARAELSYLEQVQTAVAQATELRDLAEIQEELLVIQGKPPLARAGVRRGQPEPAPTPLHFISSDGLAIRVGKNNKQNDHLTFKLARPQDIWLHAQNIPGSHVVVTTGEDGLPDATLHEAAMLAAYYSQAREAGQVPIVYTRRKHVKKPRGARPGMVIYEQERTLYVSPDPAGLPPEGGR